MKINFRSEIFPVHNENQKQKENSQVIEFEAEAKITKSKKFTKIVSFEDPREKIQNKISFSAQEIMLKTGNNYIHMVLGQKIKNNFHLEVKDPKTHKNLLHSYDFFCLLNETEFDEQKNVISFRYSMISSFEKTKSEKLGDFHIQITIKKQEK